MEKNLTKIDVDKNNSIPTQKQKTVRVHTPIKHRPTLQKELEDIDMEDKSNIALNKSDDLKVEQSSNKNQNKRAQSYPSGFENIPKKYNIDMIILKLLSVRNKKNKEVKLEYNEINWLCEEVTKIFLNQPVCLNLESPVNVCGDIHGQYSDLIRLFEAGGYPPEVNYLFLGDYVDRGEQSIETICLLFCFKIKCSQTFFLLRGNHECASLNREYGFYDECKRRYNIRLWKKFVDVFNCMPYSAIVEDKIIFMHGGLSPSLKNLGQLNEIIRPTDVPDLGLLFDLLNSNPSKDVIEYDEDPAQFIKNILSPAELKSIKVIQKEGSNKIAIVTADSSNKRIAIGKNGVNIERAKLLAKRQHDISNIILK